MPKPEKKQKLTKTLRLVRKILASYTANCNFQYKSNFSSKTLILTNSFAYSELVRLLCLRFVPKPETKQKLTKTMRLVRKILASYTVNCNLQYKSNFSSKTLILTKSFADSALVRPVCLRFVPKTEKKQNVTKTQPLTFSVLYGRLQFPPQI